VRERPAHGGGWFVGIHLPCLSRHDAFAMLEIGCKYPVEAGEIQPRPGHQGRQSCNKVQRFQHHVGRAVLERMFIAIDHPAPAIDGQAFCRNGRAGDVTAQAFQAAALVGLAEGGGVQ